MTVTQDDALTWTVGGVTYEVKARRRNSFDPDQPRDRKGRWIETGAEVSIWGGGRGTVSRNLGGGYLEVSTDDQRKLRVHRNYLTVTKRPNGEAPSDRPKDRPRPLRPGKPSSGVQDFTPDTPDTRVQVADLQPDQVALVYGHDQEGAATSRIGRVASVSEVGPSEGADTTPGEGWAVTFNNVNDGKPDTIYTSHDAVARVIPRADFDQLAEAEWSGDGVAAARIATAIFRKVHDADDAEANAGPGDGREGGKRGVDAPDAPAQAAPAAPPAPDAPAEQPAAPGKVTAADVQTGDRVTFQVPVTKANAARFANGSSPPKVGDTVTVRGVLADTPEEDMFGGHTVRLGDGARWETGRGIGPLSGDGREWQLDEGHEMQKIGTGQSAHKPAAGPPSKVQQNGLFLEPDRAGTQEMFDPYAADFETVNGQVPRPEPERAPASDVEADIRAAYRKFADRSGGYVSLHRIRAELGDTGPNSPRRAEVDAALRQMFRQPDVHISEDHNRKVVSAEQRDGAIRLGDQDLDLISIEENDWEGQGEEARPERNRDREHTGQTQAALDNQPTPAPAADPPAPVPAPAGISDRDRDRIISLIEEEAAAYAWTGSPARYLAELHAKNTGAAKYPGDSDPAVQRWMEDYLNDHPDLLNLSSRARADRKRQRQEREEQELAQAQALSRQASDRFNADDFDGAAELIEEAADLAPTALDWDRIRQTIAEGRAKAARDERSGLQNLTDDELDAQVARGQRRVDAARAAGARARDDGDSELAEALNAPLVAEQAARRQRAVEPTQNIPEEAAPARAAAPEGQAYADEIRVGDTITEATWNTPSRGDGRIRQGSTVYANPAGPARLGQPDRDSKKVVDVQPAMGGDGVTLILDDGTSVTRPRDALVTRGTPAEVVEDGQRVGEWAPSTAAAAGDRIRFPAGTPTLPTRLDRDGLGLNRTERLTVEGRVVRRQSGQPTAVLTDVTLIRADGTRVPVDAEYSWRLPRRVVRLDDSQPAEPPREALPSDLHDGDRITTPDGDVQIDSTEALPDAGVVIAHVRDDEDRRSVRALQGDRPVQFAPDTPDAPAAPPAEPEAVAFADVATLPEGTPSGRVRLRTDQRKRLLELNLDAAGGDAPEPVRQAAARLRARQELSGEQMRALAGHLRALSRDEGQPGARRRSLARTAGWVDAAYARLEGFPPPPHDPNRTAPEKAHARNLTMGDTIALPGDDGTVSWGTVTVMRPVKGYGLVAVHVRREDGSVERHVLPDRVDLWVMPDLPDDVPAAPAMPDGYVREHVTADRVNVGDQVRWDGDDATDPILGTVDSITRVGDEFAVARQYQVTVLDSDNQSRTFTVTDQGWPSLVRLRRGGSSAGQPYDTVMPPEPDANYAGWRDLKVGDRGKVDMVTGTITGITRHPAVGDTPAGATITLLSDTGQERAVPVFDDPDLPEGVVDPTVMRLIPADRNASARVRQIARQQARITQEREFTAALATHERNRTRWAATDVRDAVRELPATTDRDTTLAAALDALDRIDSMDDTAAAALAFQLGAADTMQAAAMIPSTQAITDAITRRATGRLREALTEADLLPGETWPRAMARIARGYRNHPPAQGVVPAGAALARLRARITRRSNDPAPVERQLAALPENADLSARLVAYRAALPDDLADLGTHQVTRATFEETTLQDLEAGRVPAVRTTTVPVPDIAEDDGPGEQALVHLAAIRAAGRDVDARFRTHLGGRDTAIQAELDTVTRRRGEAWKQLDAADGEVVRLRRGGLDHAAQNLGYGDFAEFQAADPAAAKAAAARVEQAIPAEVIQRREAAAAAWHQQASREAELRGMLATARRDALVATLSEIRPVGGEGITYTDRTGKALTGRAGSNAAALRYVEQALPADWLAVARALGPVEVVSGNGRHVHDPETGRYQIGLPADRAAEISQRDGALVSVPVPSSQPGGVPKASVAAHELGHHMEAAVPGLVAAERLMHFDRTSFGRTGDRTRSDPVTGTDRGADFEAYPGDFPHPYTGRVYRDGEAYEVFTSVLESLAGGRDNADDDMRHWGLGVLALLGTTPEGPRGGTPKVAQTRDPLDGITLSALSDEQLRELLGRLGDPDARARVRAELDGRAAPEPDTDLSGLLEADLLGMLERGWARYGEDPDATATQDRVIAELEAREGGRRDDLDGIAESDLATMDTDDLAGLLTRNWPRYDAEPQVAAMLDQIMAELDGRERARREGRDDPYAGIDLTARSDEDLEELRARHEGLYDSDPDSARLTKRIFAEMDARDLAKAQAVEVSETDRRIDALISQGWTPRDAYAEVHGLDVEEMERQERLALVDAERQKGERREDAVRRMYRQWVHEQWLAAEQATRGYLLNRAGVTAGIDPKSLWGGNRARAGKYASEELKRWWSEQPQGGRMTYDEWRAQWLGDQADRRTARERRQSGGRGDFGL
ncbi:hypothetical protein [Streptosporangium sp. NPDC051022]|uniref:hypothetical protein n=1 Tax=Streptosporangium sp. NPDC051022 TaxID=3155752 RepID=UPI00341FE577